MASFGDDCPGSCADGIAVHQAVIPSIDEGGDVVMPQYYGLCCECWMAQHITKYGLENVQPCGCDLVPLQALARSTRDEALLKHALVDAQTAAWREQFLKDRELQGTGTIVELYKE